MIPLSIENKRTFYTKTAKKMIFGPSPIIDTSNNGFTLACEKKSKLKDPAYSNRGYFLRIKKNAEITYEVNSVGIDIPYSGT